MLPATPYLLTERSRARWMRFDTAQILKRYFFCERALLVAEAAWLPLIASIEIKTELPRFIWQSAQTAQALRERVFELRFPSRMLDEEGPDRDLVSLVNQIKNSPSVAAFLLSLAGVLMLFLRDCYCEYLKVSDPIADGPTHRFLKLALEEKEEQVRTVSVWAEEALATNSQERDVAVRWARAIGDRLTIMDNEGVVSSTMRPEEAAPLTGSGSYVVPDRPARDQRFWSCRFYWPDIVDPSFPYGDGLKLQLRSAISHLNEVWAVETGGVILSAFAHVLPWDWINDAARWTYDESRHCQMGYNRLCAWGFDPAEIPLGTYIYESAAGQDPIYRLGMLYFFETKNIGRKPERTAAFKEIGDTVSEHDMDFDWADETIHATYGNRWLKSLHEIDSEQYPAPNLVREHCEELVQTIVAKASHEEKRAITDRANALIQRASILAAR